MANRRRFNRSERIDLYLAAGGRCTACGLTLSAGWHADHVTPYALGGATNVVNGQALCPMCNLRKGGGIRMEQFTPRGHQARMAVAVNQKIAEREKLLVGNIFPASGKTAGYLNAANILFQADVVDAVVVCVPRINLAIQAENDWESLRGIFTPPVMGAIRHRENTPPLFRRELDGSMPFGYVTTYASLMAKPSLHKRELAGRRYCLILDEAQQLGVDDEGNGTQSAREIEELAADAAFVILVSGTPHRADKRPLLLATYSEPDERGMRYLVADVEAGYREGVERGYIRPFDFTLADGRGTYEYLDGTTEEMVLSEMRSGLRKVVEHHGYWEPMVDMTVERVLDVQLLDPAYCGLIGASTQSHAQEVQRYLAQRHQGVRSLIAISDERLAQDNLRAFKRGGHDILITVAMAHVGYDYKPITVVCMLNDFREFGWVVQFLARGLRMWSLRPPGEQVLHAICPPDPAAVKIFEWMRNESRLGVKERNQGPGPGPGTLRLGKTQDAELTDRSVLGFDERGDVLPEEFSELDRIVREYRLAGSALGNVKRMLTDFGVNLIADVQRATEPKSKPHPVSQMTEQEREVIKRNAIGKRLKSCDRTLMDAGVPNADYGFSATEMKRAFGKGLPQCSLRELAERESWIETEWLPSVEAMTRRSRGYAAV